LGRTEVQKYVEAKHFYKEEQARLLQELRNQSKEDPIDDIYNRWYTKITNVAPFAGLWITCVILAAVFGGVFPSGYTHWGWGIDQDTYETYFGDKRTNWQEECTLFNARSTLLALGKPELAANITSADAGLQACFQLDYVRTHPLKDSNVVLLLGFYIDTPALYFSLLVFVTVSMFLSTFFNAIPATYLSNEVQDSCVKDIPFSYSEIQSSGVYLQGYFNMSQI